MSLGSNIQRRRKAMGFSQEYVAEQLDISRQAVAKWEADKSRPTSVNLVRLAALLETSVAALNGLEEMSANASEQVYDERLKKRNEKMLSGRFFSYLLFLSGIQGFFKYYPNDAPQVWWLTIIITSCIGLFFTSRDMYKHHQITWDQCLAGVIFIFAVVFLPRVFPFESGMRWLFSTMVAGVCIIYLNLKYWRYIWPVRETLHR